MRALLLTLLFINLAYFGYTRLGGDAGEAKEPADVGPPVPRLTLVGEGEQTPARCSTVGPFTTQAAAQRAAAWLLGSRYGSRLRSADAPGASSYWVAITTKTLQDATKIGLRLRAAGVTDLVIMPPEAGATDAIVSLGIYSERDHAEKRITDLRRYAVAPKVIEQPHTVTTWWLDVDIATGEAGPDVAGIAKSSGESGSLRTAACAAAAPTAAAPTTPTPTTAAPTAAPAALPAAGATAPTTAGTAAAKAPEAASAPATPPKAPAPKP